MRLNGIIIGVVAVGTLALGCSSKEAAPASEPAEEKAAPAPAPAPSEPVAAKDPAVEAQEIFQARCVTCHGENGKGDGPGSAALNPKPRDYTSAKWQKSVTDEHIAKVIVGGGTAVGLSALMPPNPDLADKPEVVAALVTVVRNLGNNK
ncbi:MAG: cytochrome c [Myxococcota bacterium]